MILAIDTATRWLGLALYDGTAVLAEAGWRSANTHTVDLAPAIEEMWRRARISAADLDGIAVAIGPGSYTGLRVGLAVAKGLAMTNRIALAGVDTLDIVAAAFGPLDARLLVAVEAGRSRVCAALYEWRKGRGWQAEAPAVIDTWENLLAGLAGEVIFAGEIAPPAAKLIHAAGKSFRLASPAMSARRAGHLAEIGWRRLQKGLVDDVATLSPVYLRDPAGM